MHIEDILDDARRYLQGLMAPEERRAFEELLERHPQLREELALLQLVREGFEALETTPPPRQGRRPWVRGLAIVIALMIGAVLALRWCWQGPKNTPKDASVERVDNADVPSDENDSLIEPIGGSIDLPYSDRGYSVAWAPSGSVLLTGIFTGLTNLGELTISSREANQMDIFLTSYNLETLDFEWVSTLSGPGDWKLPMALAAGPGGEIALTGGYGPILYVDGLPPLVSDGLADAGHGDYFLVSFDAGGQAAWGRHAGGDRIENVQTGSNIGSALAIDPADGAVVVSGGYVGSPRFGDQQLPAGGPNEDLFLARYDAEGDLQWVRAVTGTYMVAAKGLAIDPQGNIFITGYFGHHNLAGSAYFGRDTLTSFGGRDIFLAKYNARGELLWVRQAGSAKAEQGHDYGNSIAVDAEGNAVITGTFTGEGHFADTVLTSRGRRDIFLAKYDPEGSLLWARRAGGDGDGYGDIGYDLAIDPQGDIYLAGNVSGTADFDPEKQAVTTNGNVDAFAARYSPSGKLQWVVNWGGEDEERDTDAATSIDTDLDGQSVITGFFSGTMQIGDHQLTSLGREDVFLLVLDADGKVVFLKKGQAI